MLKYRALFERYRDLIAAGTYAPGERLPSLRSVAAVEGLGLNTVRAAFDLLERDGLARPLPRGGYYARGRKAGRSLSAYSPPRECSEAEGLSASRKIEYLLGAGGASAGFALAEADPSLLPSDRLEKEFAALPGQWIGYGDPAGEEELRRRIAATYHPYHGSLEPEGILVTNGATEALSLVMRAFLEPGDEVALESPTYYDYYRQLASARARIVEVPVRAGGGMDLDMLEARLKAREVKMIIVQPNVQNPTGSVMSDGDKARLLGLASRRGLFLVQDDVYGDLAFSRDRPRNLGAFGDYDRLIYLSSFSKTLAPGLRIGWAAAPALRAELARAKGLCSLATSRPPQRALAAYLAGNSYRRHLERMRAALESQLEDYLDLLAVALPDGSSAPRPAGAVSFGWHWAPDRTLPRSSRRRRARAFSSLPASSSPRIPISAATCGSISAIASRKNVESNS